MARIVALNSQPFLFVINIFCEMLTLYLDTPIISHNKCKVHKTKEHCKRNGNMAVITIGI